MGLHSIRLPNDTVHIPGFGGEDAVLRPDTTLHNHSCENHKPYWTNYGSKIIAMIIQRIRKLQFCVDTWKVLKAYKLVAEKSEGKSSFGRPKRRLEDINVNIVACTALAIQWLGDR
jgi:hypothetical protein